MSALDDLNLSKESFLSASRVSGSKNSYKRDNPGEYSIVVSYLNGGAEPNFSNFTLMGKALCLEERARRSLVASPDPNPQPNPLFGAKLTRLAESTGSVYTAASLFELNTALNSVPNGSTIKLTQSIDGNGAQFNIDRLASAAAPITVLAAPGVKVYNFYMFGYMPQGGYLRFRGFEATQMDSFVKPTSNAHDVELDKCVIHHLTGQGFLASKTAKNWQLWNSKLYNNGDEANLDHGIYASYSAPGCIIANCLIYDNWAYNVQLYPDCSGLIMTCCTLDGYTVQPDSRGGLVIGSESYAGGSNNNILVGLLITNSSPSGNGAINVNQPLGTGNKVYDTIEYGNPYGFESDPGITYTNCVRTDPKYVDRASKNFKLQQGSPAIGFIDQSRYDYVPAFDIDGKPRSTADAGCYAF